MTYLTYDETRGSRKLVSRHTQYAWFYLIEIKNVCTLAVKMELFVGTVENQTPHPDNVGNLPKVLSRHCPRGTRPLKRYGIMVTGCPKVKLMLTNG